MTSLENLLEFTNLLNQFQDIKRAILHQNKDTFEDDAQHSYQLAMLT